MCFLFFAGMMCDCNRSYAVASPPHLEPGVFRPQKVLILTKLSRYEFERRRHPELTEKQLEKCLRLRGSDYNNLLYHHYIHKVGYEKILFRYNCLVETVMNNFHEAAFTYDKI